MRDVEPRQVGGELPVLPEQAVVGARVEPETRAGGAKRPRHVTDLEQRAVRVEPRTVLPEDRADRIGLLVARPALHQPELARVVKGDVDRSVAALGKTADRAGGAGRDRPVAGVDGADEVA
jgi:hypothetical protein